MADMGEQPGQGQLIVHGEAGPRRKKMINLLNRSPSPVILEDYGDLEPSKCTVGGPGIAGGIVGVATQVTVTARDASHVRIREGGHQFVLTIKHSGKGGDVKTYDSVDHGDGHYSFSGVRADLKGMHQVSLFVSCDAFSTYAELCVMRQVRLDLIDVVTDGLLCVQLSVEVNGTLVGDSPYLVMFEIDDDAELTTENADGTMPVARKSAATSIKERIVFLQRMNPAMTPEVMTDVFEKFGRVMKCEKMLPARDMWMIQFSRAEDAAEAVSINGNEIMGCQVTVALASTLGGVGTHPIIMQQLQHIQAMHFQEQQSTSWATQLAAQRASIRQAGGEVEELTDTRKRRKALALMARLQAKVEQAKGSSGGGGGGGAGGLERDASLGGEGGSRSAPADGHSDGGAGAQDLRNRTRDTRSKSRDRDRGDHGRDDREKRSRDVERERRGRDDEYERRDRGGPEMRSRDRGRDRVREQEYGRRDGDWRAGDRNGRERRNDERDMGRDGHYERERRPHVEEHRGDERRVDERSSRRRVERGDDRRGDDRRREERRGDDRHGGERDRDREKAHTRSREKDVGGRDGDSRRHREDRHRESGRSRGRDEDREARGRAGRDEREAPAASSGRNGMARSKRPDDE